MRIAPLIVAILLLSPICLAQEQFEVIMNDGLHIMVISESFDPRQLEMFLCREDCISLEASSVSYNGRNIDIFAEPEEPGFYDLKVFLGDKVYEEKVKIVSGKPRPQQTSVGVTSNIVKNSTSPVFVLGLIGISVLFVFLRREKTMKTKHLIPFKSEIKFLSVFVLSFLVLSPFTHELFHILTAGGFGCEAVLESFIPVFTPTSVSLGCEIGVIQSIAILVAGLMGNLALGLVFFTAASRKKSIPLYSLSLAFIWSSIFYLFYSTGDLHNIMRIIGINLPQIYLNLSGIALISTSFYVFFSCLRR